MTITNKMSFTIITSDKIEFKWSLEMAKMSEFLVNGFSIESDYETDQTIEITTINSSVFQIISDITEHYIHEPFGIITKPIKSRDLKDNNVPLWYHDYLSDISVLDLCYIALALDFLAMDKLLPLIFAKFATLIKGLSPHEVLELFHEYTVNELRKIPICSDLDDENKFVEYYKNSSNLEEVNIRHAYNKIGKDNLSTGLSD